MSTTARFKVLRSKEIEKIFSSNNLKELWRSEVKNILRKQDLLDLHDYYDFNRSIQSHAADIEAEVLGGRYRPEPPLVFRLEKKMGICRHMCLPTPTDSLVFQALTNALEKKLLAAAPNTRSLFSRTHARWQLPHEHGEPTDYPWFIKWKRFQKQIWNFSKEYDYLIVTDLANYFDSIGLRELRNVIASHVKSEEVILDLLFRVIEGMSWNPDYLPNNMRGLPTINLDAPRLLAHSYLYEIDSVLESSSSGSFVRWMDDINIGVNDKITAKKIISQLSDVLKSRGLSLNVSKTNILSTEQVKVEFMVDENTYLDEIQKIKKPTQIKIRECNKKFNKTLKDSSPKAWQKVVKRYIALGGTYKLKSLDKKIPELFFDYPDMRSNIISYLSSQNPDTERLEIWKSLVKNEYLDDITQFNLAKLFTQWELPINSEIKDCIQFYIEQTQHSDLFGDQLAGLWVRAKYSEPEELLKYFKKYENLWKHNKFLARQNISAVARLLPWKKNETQAILNSYVVNSSKDVSSVASNLLSLSNLDVIPRDVSLYVFPTSGHKKNYPLYKYLILSAVLTNDCAKNNSGIKAGLNKYITDPWYKKWINEYASGHSF